MAQKVLHEQSSDIGLQAGVLRNRVPTSIITAIGGEAVEGGTGSDAIAWQAIQDGNQVYIVGTLQKRAAVGRQVPVRAAAPRPPAKKGAAKKAAPKRPTRGGDDLADAFGDDAPAANTRPAPPVRRVMPPAVPTRRPIAPPAPPARRAAAAPVLPRPVRNR